MQLSTSRIYVSLTLLFIVTLCYSQNQLTLKKGIVTDSLNVPSTNNSFSIYLPRNFDPNKNWPIVLGFDSSGKESGLTRLYMAAAEELGYIVAISNFNNDQTPKEKANYVPVFMTHIFSLFPIQIGRVYVTGMGKDAEIASLLPLLIPDKIFGVVAIANSHYYKSNMRMKKNFSYIAMTNNGNHRYKDLLANKNLLKRKAIAADVFVHDGDLDFPDQLLIRKALSTFTAQAMLKGRMPKDSIWIQKRFQEDIESVDNYLEKEKYVIAHDELKRIRIHYNSFFDTDHLKEKQKEIRKLNGYKREKRLQSKFENKEIYLREGYLFSADEDIELLNYENLGWWQYEVTKLDSLLISKQKPAQNMAKRVKGYLKHLVDSYKEIELNNQDDFEKKMFLNVFSTIVDKKDFESYKRIISFSARDQDYETALFYLEKMLQNGYKDFESLYTIEGTLALKLSKDYNRLIKKYLGNSKYFFSK
ncbi:hypothetical protein [Aquimarina sp. AU474]|uniref:hypothetical protein n=1 Tax=Aquimarina sp. AU474 TaxID=2108529 RepID=UPI000D6858B7|nr:hypothetical protein [Aquimarina sp. AU474]